MTLRQTRVQQINQNIVRPLVLNIQAQFEHRLYYQARHLVLNIKVQRRKQHVDQTDFQQQAMCQLRSQIASQSRYLTMKKKKINVPMRRTSPRQTTSMITIVLRIFHLSLIKQEIEC